MSIFHMATYPMLALFLLGDRRKHVLLAQGARKCGIDTQEPATDSDSALPKQEKFLAPGKSVANLQ